MKATLEREEAKPKQKFEEYSSKKEIAKVALGSDEIGDKAAAGN